MAYATKEDLKKRLKRHYEELYSDDDTDVLDEELMQLDLDAASAEIDGSVAARYAIPVNAAPAQPLLKSWNLDLTAAIAFSRSGYTELPETIKNAADFVRKQLQRIVEGKLRLPADPAEKTTGNGGVAIVEGPDPVFTRNKMSGF